MLGFKKLKTGDGNVTGNGIYAFPRRSCDSSPLNLRDMKTIVRVSRPVFKFVDASFALRGEKVAELKCQLKWPTMHAPAMCYRDVLCAIETPITLDKTGFTNGLTN